jgi:hypothetical protein
VAIVLPTMHQPGAVMVMALAIAMAPQGGLATTTITTTMTTTTTTAMVGNTARAAKGEQGGPAGARGRGQVHAQIKEQQ